MKKMLQRQAGERPEPKATGFGRGPLVSGILRGKAERTRQEQQIFHSMVIRETVLSFVQAKKDKEGLQRMVIDKAKELIKGRMERESQASCSKDEMTTDQRKQVILERALRSTGKEFTIKGRRKTLGGGLYFEVQNVSTGEEHRIPISKRTMESADPVADTEGMLRALGIGGNDRIKSRTLSFECYNPPSVEKLEVSQNDLKERKTAYQGRIKKIDDKGAAEFHSFTYKEKGYGTTLNVPAELKGEELLKALEHKIFQSKVKYASGHFRFQNGEMFEEIKDQKVRMVAKRLYSALWTDTEGQAIPEDVRQAISDLQSTTQYSNLAYYRANGLLSDEEAGQFIEACSELEPNHPLHEGVMIDLGEDSLREVAAFHRQNGLLSKEEADQFIETAVLQFRHPVSDLCEDALRNLAEAQHAVIGGPERDVWSFDVLKTKQAHMMYIILKGANALNKAFSD